MNYIKHVKLKQSQHEINEVIQDEIRLKEETKSRISYLKSLVDQLG